MLLLNVKLKKKSWKDMEVPWGTEDNITVWSGNPTTRCILQRSQSGDVDMSLYTHCCSLNGNIPYKLIFNTWSPAGSYLGGFRYGLAGGGMSLEAVFEVSKTWVIPSLLPIDVCVLRCESWASFSRSHVFTLSSWALTLWNHVPKYIFLL